MVLPGMSDGRQFTSYISNCKLNSEWMSQVNALDNNSYRKYLQDNAEKMMMNFRK
jgi:hypothetical protein